MDKAELIAILEIGLQAASPYNVQPWQFSFTNDQLLIFPRHNIKGFWSFKDLIYYCLGAFLENLSEGAKHHKYEISYEVFEELPQKPVCVVSFKQNLSLQPISVDHIKSRHTNRKLYHATPVPSHILDQMHGIFQGQSCTVLNVTGKQDFIVGCAFLERVRVSNRSLNDELVEAVCYSEAEAIKRKSGLDLRTLELPAQTQGFLRAMRNPWLRNSIGRSALPQFLAEAYTKNLLLNAPLLVAFKETDPSRLNFVKDWKDIQKILNLLHQNGLSAHLLASGVDATKIDPSLYSVRERGMMEQVQKRFINITGTRSQNILTLLRVGFADACQIKVLRFNPQELFLS